MAVHDVSVSRGDLSIVRKAVSNPLAAVSITDRVWITICRRVVIDTSGRGPVRRQRNGRPRDAVGSWPRFHRRLYWDLYRMVDRSSCQPSVRFTGQGSRLRRTLLAVQQRQSPTPYVAGRVRVRVVRVAAGHALECRLALPRRGVDVPARVAGAAGVLGRHFDDSGRLVREHLARAPPIPLRESLG